MNKIKFSNGMSLVEVIIASAVVLLLSIILIYTSSLYFKTSSANIKNIKAVYLAEEGIEAVNLIKNTDWNNLGTFGTAYYLFWNGTVWQATTTKNIIDQTYERKFITESVNRDSNDDITLSGGNPDSNTRKLTVNVSWSDVAGTTTKSLSTYIFNNND